MYRRLQRESETFLVVSDTWDLFLYVPHFVYGFATSFLVGVGFRRYFLAPEKFHFGFLSDRRVRFCSASDATALPILDSDLNFILSLQYLIISLLAETWLLKLN